jgi:hypothetical protein
MLKFNPDLLTYTNLVMLGFNKDKKLSFTSLQFNSYGSATLFAINNDSNCRVIFNIYHDGFVEMKTGDTTKDFEKSQWLEHLKQKVSWETIKSRVPSDRRKQILNT